METTTLATIKFLEERYPFSEEELEILVRAHENLCEHDHKDDFLVTLAKAMPYSVFFLPGDGMRDRVNWIEDHILPMGFSSNFRCAITTDAFVDYANVGVGKSLERFIEGVADTGRRGSKEALKMTYDILDEEATAESLVELCVCLAVASEALVVPNLEKDATLKRLQDAKPCVLSMARNLVEYCKDGVLSRKVFIDWAETKFPGLASTLSTFVHNLLFHGHAFPKTRIPYTSPKIYETSEIFKTETSPLLMALSFSNTNFGGKWHRLYSSDVDGLSFNRLEWSLLGYTGPTVTLVKTTENATLGAYTDVPWKERSAFFGDSGGFLFHLEPSLDVYRAQGKEKNFAYLHTSRRSTLMPSAAGLDLPCGLGFGRGTSDEPRLFVPESLEHCSASFFDKTYETGELLPDDALDKFEVAVIEIWALGGGEVIQNALRNQAEYRELHESLITNARVVHDKTQFVTDFESGLIPSTLFDHKQQARGRKEFAVDDEHGGYKVERE